MKPDLSGLKKVGATMGEEVRKHAPTILSVGACFGLGLTVIFTAKATPKAIEILKERDEKLSNLEKEADESTDSKEIGKNRLKVHAETVIEMAPIVAPALTSGLFTVGCIVGADRINVNRLAAMSAGYDILKDSFNRYKKANLEAVEEKKEREVEIAAAQSKTSDTTLSEDFMINTGFGNQIYLDAISGRYFRANKSAIERAVNIVNNGINNFMFVSLNEFYANLGIPAIKIGDEWGWNDVPLTVVYSYTETPSGDHCIVIDYDISIRHRFGDY